MEALTPMMIELDSQSQDGEFCCQFCAVSFVVVVSRCRYGELVIGLARTHGPLAVSFNLLIVWLLRGRPLSLPGVSPHSPPSVLETRGFVGEKKQLLQAVLATTRTMHKALNKACCCFTFHSDMAGSLCIASHDEFAAIVQHERLSTVSVLFLYYFRQSQARCATSSQHSLLCLATLACECNVQKCKRAIHCCRHN